MGSMHSGLEGHSIPGWVEKYVLGSESEHSLTRMAVYFKERAIGGVGLMVTGGIAPNKAGWAGPFGAKLTNHSEMEAHKVVTDAVHSVDIPIHGTSDSCKPKICLQLLHTGRYAFHPLADSASATKSPISPFKAWEMSVSRIQTTVEDFVNSSKLAQHAGYDGVEVMGSEGYLFSQFLSPRTNFRKDKFGGSFENRMRFPLQVVQDIRAAIGPKFIIIFRISLLDLVDGGMTFEESCLLARALEEAGVTILNTGIGWHEARVPTIAPCVPRGAFGFVTKRLKDANVVKIPLVSTNRINMPQTAEALLKDGASDLVSLARPLLADSQFLNKAKNQESHLINTCIACNQACLDHAFLGKTVSCLVNPRACHETEMPIPHPLPEDQRLLIGVVGAGPAGCAFAITAAELGHSVTLYDQEAEIGGQFNLAKRIPGKEEFHETLRYFQNQLEAKQVNIELNTIVTYDMMKKLKVDKWIISTGVNPRAPQIPGSDHQKVLSYLDVLKHNKPVGHRVAIVGAGGIGFDVAEYLLYHEQDKGVEDVFAPEYYKEWGIDTHQKTRYGLTEKSPKTPNREIHLMQRKKGKIGANLGKTTGWIHRASLKQGKVKMINGVTYDMIDENGNLHYTQKGKQLVLEVDTIVLCAGQVEKTELQDEAGSELQPKMYPIGGTYEAHELDAKRAIDSATRLAYRIHEPGVEPGKHILQAPAGTEEKFIRIMSRFMF